MSYPTNTTASAPPYPMTANTSPSYSVTAASNPSLGFLTTGAVMAQPVFTMQPGMIAVPCTTGIMWVPAPSGMPVLDVPPGLDHLSRADFLSIQLMVDPIEFRMKMEVGCEGYAKKVYTMRNSRDEEIYYAFEESSGCSRCCFRSDRGLVMHVVDTNRKEVIRITRPCKLCPGGCGGMYADTSCCSNECIIESPPGILVGRVSQRSANCFTKLSVSGADGQEMLQVHGPNALRILFCTDQKFQFRSVSNTVIGGAKKQWRGCKMEWNKDYMYTMNFPHDLDIKLKAVLLGTTFLLDLMHF